MFTGIIEELGTIATMDRRTDSIRLGIRAEKVLEGTQLGDSIAVNGVCLTVTEMTEHLFYADVMHESMLRTSFCELHTGSQVNLERAMQLGGRLGGHIVSGHIDGTGTITDMKTEDNAVWLTVSTGYSLLRYMIEKGSIAIDGVSLTLAYVDDRCFKVSIIPHTGEETILLKKKPGDTVNLECDLIGKYVEKLLTHPAQPDGKAGTAAAGGLTEEFLAENGFF